ncbi:MAG: hypothetical protein N2202_00600 [Proteobacteria bacterium]|nr:hypothetical protein [Pseudomonadota bacterium]
MKDVRKINCDGVITSRRKIANNIYHIKIELEERFPIFAYGNFVMVHLKDYMNVLLPRPFSIFRAKNKILELVFKEVGTGTKMIATSILPFNVRVWGPLGNSFPFGKDMLCVAGGLGLIPLYQSIIKRNFKEVFVGFKNIYEAYFVKSLQKRGVIISSDDGSLGERGFVTEIFYQYLKRTNFKGKVVSCGPIGFLKRLWEIEREVGNIETYGSFEKHMACGFGVCLGCAMETPWGFVKVCSDGPVFRLKDVFGE